MDRDPFDLVGDVLDGQFRVVAFAGEGDLSVVYKGHHIGVDAPVAIKCLNLPTTLDGALVRPLVETFREASRLHYTLARGNLNIAQSIASGSTLAPATGMIVPYLVREWFEGESLGSELARRRAEGKKGRSIDETIALLDPAVDAVSYAHVQGALHLSLNPSNLFLADKGGKRALKVLDFGVSRAMNDLAQELPPDSRPSAGLRVLFPSYAAPEQLDTTVGKTGGWTDVYALALLFMELMSDRVVMGGHETGALVERVLDDQRRPTPRTHGLELPRNLDLVLTRAVARAPERRQRTAKDFWNDVKTSLRGSTSRGFSVGHLPLRPAAPVSAAPPPASVAGAVPPKRILVPDAPSTETIPMSFEPLASVRSSSAVVPAPAAPAASAPVPTPITIPVPAPPPAVERPVEIDLPPVHVLTTPPPPHVETPALPPVIVAFDTPARPAPAFSPPPEPELPPHQPPAPTFPILERPVERRRSGAVWFTLIAAIVGAAVGVAVVVFFKRHATAQAATSTPAPALAPAPPPPPPPTPTPTPTPTPDPSAPPPTPHFPAIAAKQALDSAAREIAHCKHGKLWGIASANVTFGNDGSVSHVAVGVPFTGTPTGQCVSDALATAKVPPFSGKPVILAHRFFVPPK